MCRLFLRFIFSASIILLTNQLLLAQRSVGFDSILASGTMSLNIFKDKLSDTLLNISTDEILLLQIKKLKSSLPTHRVGRLNITKPSAAPVRFSHADISNTIVSNPLLLLNFQDHLIQNTFQSNFSFTVKERYSFSGYVMYRKTLRGALPDFFDFHIGYAGKVPLSNARQLYDKDFLQSQFLRINLFDSIINVMKSRISQIERFSVDQELLHRALKAKETISNYQVDSSYKFLDSVIVAEAKRLVEIYDGVKDRMASAQKIIDTLTLYRDKFLSVFKAGANAKELIGNELSSAKAFLNHGLLPSTEIGRIKDDISKGALTRLSFGRVLPSQSDLTLKNLSLRGLDFQYEARKYSLSASAGLIDFRMNDLILKRRVEKPLPYAVVLYAGFKPTNTLRIGLRYFNGRRDNYAQGIKKPSVSGVALQAGYNSKGKTFEVEVARNINAIQSIYDTVSKGPRSLPSDNMAVSVKSSVIIPSTKTVVSGLIAMQGKHYNAFNTFNINTQTKRYEVKISQDLFNRTIRLSGWVRNSEFTPSINGIVIQNDVTLKSFSVTFRKRKFPIISLGYNPVKQAFIQDSTIQVLIYNGLSGLSSYNYLLGERKAAYSLIVNKLGSREASGISGSYLSNSVNVVFDHSIDFDDYATLLSISYTKSEDFLYTVFRGGFQINSFRQTTVNTAFTINNYNNNLYKIGGNLGFNVRLQKNGMLTMDYNLSFLPSVSGQQLTKYNYGSLSFRYNLIN